MNTGLTRDPIDELARLVAQLVRLPSPAPSRRSTLYI